MILCFLGVRNDLNEKMKNMAVHEGQNEMHKYISLFANPPAAVGGISFKVERC